LTLELLLERRNCLFCNDFIQHTYFVFSCAHTQEGVEGMYRNPLKEVQKFFNTYHPDQYKVYNLCAEVRNYPLNRKH